MHKKLLATLAIVAGLFVFPLGANAELIWDIAAGDEGTITEGDGTWASGGGNWNTGTGDTTWDNANPTVARFGNILSTSNHTVSVDSGGVTATGLAFKKTYTLQTGAVTLSGTAPVVGFTADAKTKTSAVINSNLLVTDGNSETADDLIIRGAFPTFSTSYNKLTLNGSNTYSGSMTLEDGVLCDLGAVSSLSGTSVVVNAGTALRILGSEGVFGSGQTLYLNGYGFGVSNTINDSRAALMFSPNPGATNDVVWAGNIVLNGDSSIATTQSGIYNNVISGIISGDFKLTKTSNTPLVLTNTNTYSGGTDIYRNILQVDGSIGTAGSTVTVGTGSYTDATLRGTGSVIGDVLVNPVGTIEAGNSIGTLTVTGNMTVDGKLKVEYDSVEDTIDKLIVNGNLDLGDATVTFSDFASAPETLTSKVYVFATYSGTLIQPTAEPIGVPEGFTINWAYGGNSIALVPEPGTLALLAGLLLAMSGLRIRS